MNRRHGHPEFACRLVSVERAFARGISALDASRVAHSAIGAQLFRPNQRLAGDVSGNGRLTSFDAALIAPFVVGIIPRFPVATMGGHDSDWAFVPASRSEFASQVSVSDLDYAGMLYGDVTANWGEVSMGGFSLEAPPTPDGPVAGLGLVAPSITSPRDTSVADGSDSTSGTGAVRGGGGGSITSGAVVFLASSPAQDANGQWFAVLGIQHAGGILGLDLTLHVTAGAARIVGVQTTGVAPGMTLASHDAEGGYNVALYGAGAISGPGEFLVVTLDRLDPAVSPLVVGAEANEGGVPVVIDPALQSGPVVP